MLKAGKTGTTKLSIFEIVACPTGIEPVTLSLEG
jgi:hypothetical protein